MKLKFFVLTVIFLLIFSGFSLSSSAADSPPLDSVIKANGKSTVYYYASDGKRYVFPNEKTYKSWFTDFADIIEVDLDTLAEIPLGGNMRYRPGVVMVKITTDPTVYVVANNGVLRSIKSEAMAKKLYGINWNLLIDDIPDAFFVNYQIGSEVESEDDYDPDEEVENTPTINHNRKLKVTNRARWANTAKCRAIPATPAVPAHKSPTGKAIPAIPATPARDCAHQGKQNDTTAPTISDISVTVDVTSAVVSWTTNENSDSAVEYAIESVASASTTDEVSDSSLVASHEMELTGLTASTTYYFIVKSADGNNNTATSSEQMFTTDEEPVVDTTAPIITDILATTQATSTVISWTTDEESTSQVEYDTQSLASSTTTQSLSDVAFVTLHSLELTSLTASTTYYFIVESMDADNNTATSSEQMFVTLE